MSTLKMATLKMALVSIRLTVDHMDVSKDQGPQNRPQYTTILVVLRTPKKMPPFMETPHIVGAIYNTNYKGL